MQDVNIVFDKYNKHDFAVYAGYLKDNTKLMQSTSGGIATALMEYMIDQGGYVAGVTYSEDFYNAEYILTNKKSDIDRLKGTKYTEIDKKNIYADVKKMLESGEKILFIGLPCIISALYKFIGKRHENLFTCELICHGPTNSKVHSDYITYLEKKYRSKVIDFSVRKKKNLWMPGFLYAKFENGKIFQKPFYETEYGHAFSVLGRKSCYSCKFKGNNREADIMIGDFWGANESDEFWNKYGVSSIFAETEKGNEFLKMIPSIELFPTTFEKATRHNPMVIISKTMKSNRDKFEELLFQKGLIYASNSFLSFRTRLSRKIPYNFKMILKNLKSLKIKFK